MLHTGASDICLPACTLFPSIEKYSDKTFISAGRCAASVLYGRNGEAAARAHSTDVTSTFENMMKSKESKSIKDIRRRKGEERRRDVQRGRDNQRDKNG